MTTMAGLDWLAENQVAPLIDTLLVQLLKEKPADPISFMQSKLENMKLAAGVRRVSAHVENQLRSQLRRVRSTAIAPQGAVAQDDEDLTQANFDIECLKGTPYQSPLLGRHQFFDDLPKVVYNCFAPGGVAPQPLLMESAGPHSQLHFDPPRTVIGLVSCGGLCPGLNDVTRAVTLLATEVYGVRKVIGFKYGWMGLMDEGIGEAFELTPSVVRDINRFGGSFLGSSRGRPVHKHGEEMVDNLVRLGVNIVFALGGDGTLKGASQLYDVIKKRGVDIAVIGIPKTIDNDVCYVQKTFGYETACNEAVVALKAAQSEARSHKHGIGLVKLMGRHSGFVAAQAAVAFGGAHIVLIPENEISLDTICNLVRERFKKRKYCVIVVAEGFGENLMASEGGTDASGNKKLGDIGMFLNSALTKWLKANYEESTVKYIDPSYMVRACPAVTQDAAFCLQLANYAVHEAMRGSTNCLIGYWNNTFTAVPISLCVSKRKFVNLEGDLWRAVREITVSMKDRNRRASAGPAPLL
uniref:Phosphofructokinase domain-containing protein n=1 Tax=Eutreptiella gymnastica TaxID=73025 RepID=A0A7S1IY48_9EUGL|mmetsp:Transcript_50927/g.91003  ORF Transcript_50927/g.91003 Transcript_50927/m.91003 type:complete len:524 (+) Transcript_50927:61-1632(+)